MGFPGGSCGAWPKVLCRRRFAGWRFAIGIHRSYHNHVILKFFRDYIALRTDRGREGGSAHERAEQSASGQAGQEVLGPFAGFTGFFFFHTNNLSCKPDHSGISQDDGNASLLRLKSHKNSLTGYPPPVCGFIPRLSAGPSLLNFLISSSAVP